MSRHSLLFRLWLLTLCAVVAAMSAGDRASAQAPDEAPRVPRGFVDRIHQDDEGEHKYVLFVPESYTPQKKWPIVLFLHGAYERGEDGRKQVEVGLGPYVKARSETFPFLAVFPQAANRPGQAITDTWSPAAPDGERALDILDSVEQEFSVDPKRRVLTGWSMGGYGVWQQAAADPKRWSALVPVSGGGDAALAKKVADLPVWAFHGADDEIVKAEQTRKMIEALKSAGGRPQYTEIAEGDHYAFETAYDIDALYQWMLNPTARAGGTTRLLVKPGVRTPPAAYENQPFRPAVVIPRAAVLRVGNDALEAVSYSIPEAIPRDVLRGRIADIHDTTTASGRTFAVTFSGIHYDARVHRARLQTTGQGSLRLTLGLEDARMQIGASYVQGRGRSAVAGPISISIGTRRPVWLTLDTEPYVDRGELRLRLRTVSFHIPDDNWSVSAPAGVRTRGLGMTQERVSNGLVRGLYGSKPRIESEIRAVVPAVLHRIEQELDLNQLAGAVGEFWPLPVFQPRVRLFAEQVAVDESGLSVAMGMSAAAIDPRQAPRAPRRVAPAGPGLQAGPRTRDLRLHVAAGALQPLTDLLIEADVARIHVNDVPGSAFARFADREALAAAIPDLKQLPEETQVWSELILAEPLALTGGNDAQNESEAAMQFALPTVIISTAVKTDPQSKTWKPYAEFRFTVSQQAHAGILSRGFSRRYFEVDWEGRPLVSSDARFAPDYVPQDSEIDSQKIADLFTECWQAWTGSGPVARRKVDDVVLGSARLRLSAAGWAEPHLYMGFSTPGLRLTNSSDRPLVYEAKGPYSRWGGPITLAAGQSHEFREPYPILFRHRTGGRNSMFTLPVGTHSEYRVPVAGGPPRLFQARETIETSLPVDRGTD